MNHQTKYQPNNLFLFVITQPNGKAPEKRVCGGCAAPPAHPFFGSIRSRSEQLLLFSDTGGGHRSATEAIIEAIHLEYGDHHAIEMVDISKDYAPLPLQKLPALYPLRTDRLLTSLWRPWISIKQLKRFGLLPK